MTRKSYFRDYMKRYRAAKKTQEQRDQEELARVQETLKWAKDKLASANLCECSFCTSALQEAVKTKTQVVFRTAKCHFKPPR